MNQFRKDRLVLSKSILIKVSFLIMFVISNANADIIIKAVGDIMPGSLTPKEILPGDEDIKLAEEIKVYLQNADIVFGNLEGAFVTESIEPKKCSEASREAARCYEFGIPESFASLLKKMNFNVLSIDNNHSADYGEEGYVFTQELLNDLNIKYTPKGGYTSVKVKNKDIIIVPFGFTHNSHHIANVKHAGAIIKNLSRKYPVIIVSFHGGAEGDKAEHVKDETEVFYSENRGNLIKLSHALIDAGADLILGHGPHVLRALELYKNKLIAYSLGNFFTYGQFNLRGPRGIGVILKVKINEENGNFIVGEIIPTVQIKWGIPAYDKSCQSVYKIKQLTLEDFPGTRISIRKNGLIDKLLD